MAVIVIIEPHLEYREILKILLEKQNLNIVTYEASNGKDGLKIIKMKKPDIVFIDIRMREVNKDKIEVSIKSIMPRCHIVMLTPFKSEAFNRWHKTEEIEDFISKDELSENFVPIIQKYLNV